MHVNNAAADIMVTAFQSITKEITVKNVKLLRMFILTLSNEFDIIQPEDVGELTPPSPLRLKSCY